MRHHLSTPSSGESNTMISVILALHARVPDFSLALFVNLAITLVLNGAIDFFVIRSALNDASKGRSFVVAAPLSLVIFVTLNVFFLFSIRLRARDGAKKNDDAAAVGAQAAKWLSESPLLGGACLFSLRDHPSWKLRYAG